MDTSTFAKMLRPSSPHPNDQDHDDHWILPDDDNPLRDKSHTIPSVEREEVQTFSVLQLHRRPGPFQQFRTASRTAEPISFEVPTPIAFSPSVASHVQTTTIFKVPENVKKVNEQGVRILAIDNGGICTFSTLYMLEVIMLQVGNLLEVPEGEELRWIALMLGRLGMTVRQSISASEQIVRNVFSDDALSKEGHPYSTKTLEVILHEIIARHAPSMQQSEIDAELLLCQVLEAARATSSAPEFFPPIVIDKVKYVAIGNNNPEAMAIDESKRIWGEGSQVACLVSLGSGLAPVVKCGRDKGEIEAAVKPSSKIVPSPIKWEEWERTEDVVGRTKAYIEVMGHEARKAAEYLAQVCSERIAVCRPMPLPPPGSCFGREDEIHRAREAILHGHHVAIVGGAGNGKSTVALDTAHCKEIEQSFTDLTRGTRQDLCFWVRCDNFDTFTRLSDHICQDIFALKKRLAKHR
ncbi:FabD/lysophospholipase-like protein [Atractiella rhizophila]|nr:FabD/lysophospholipase-like protein [Atractiella rhizophila]